MVLNRENIFCELIQKTLPDIRIFDMLYLYDTLQCLGIEAKKLYDQINSTLIGYLISTEKTWETATIDKDDCTFSVVSVYSK